MEYLYGTEKLKNNINNKGTYVTPGIKNLFKDFFFNHTQVTYLFNMSKFDIVAYEKLCPRFFDS